MVGTGLRSSYKINYSALYGAATDPITITCRYWRNPIIPAVDTGYVIQTLDYDSNLMDVSAEFSLDATAYTPYQVLDSDVAYKVDDSVVQTSTKYTVDIQSPVPFEITGCYVKFNFPKELQVDSSLTVFTGGTMMLDENGGSDLTPVDSDLTSASKWVILKGCQNTAFQNANSINQLLEVQFSQIKNPFSVRDTSPFVIQVFKDWSAANGLENQIIQTNAKILLSHYSVNSLTFGSLTATNKIVQEATTHTYEFTTSSIIPGTSPGGAASDIMPAFHIFFPRALTKDETNQQADVITISGTNSVSVSGTPSYEVDASLNYNELC